MNKKTLFATIMVMLMVVSCKTSESNYRAAYEVAKEKAMDGVDGDTYARIQAEDKPVVEKVAGDSVGVIYAAVKVVSSEKENVASLHKYNVVVAKFRQIFNAKAMCSRLSDNGYNAYLLQDGEPSYYVIAAGADDAEVATATVATIKGDKSIVIKEPYPCLLVPANMR